MRILYVNFIDNLWGHKRLDENLIEILSTFAEVTVISPNGWYEYLSSEVKVINYNPKSIFRNISRISHYYSLKIMKFAAKLDKKEKYDYIFVASFDTYALALGRLFFKKQNRLYVMHHNNTDMLSRKKVNFFFKTYVYKVKHIVLEKFIADYLIERYLLSSVNVLILPHPLYKNKSVSVLKKFVCVGISNSNDENLIKEIIVSEKENKILEKNNLFVILRSKTQTFDNGYLKVITDYLETDNYNYFINNACSLFLPFPETFKFRMSSSIMDGLSNKTIVIGTDIPMLKTYSKKYPHICYIVKNSDEFLERVKTIKNFNSSSIIKQEFKEFEEGHSRKKIKDILSNEFIE